ncbi:MAG TPA: AMIN domain-containing protein, partial [Terriglobales bacterium]|nr:AMIN domain-containing protein [Terriglobales bacterium]
MSAARLSCPALAQTTSLAQAAASVEITNIQAVPTATGVDVEISGSAALTGSITVLENPARIAVDILIGVPRADYRRIPVQKSGVISVRESLFRTAPATVRVVVDLEKPTAHQLITQGNKLILRLSPAAATTPSAASSIP